MSFRYKKLLQTITFLLVVCLANGSVFAVLPAENSPAAAVKGKTLPSGILNTFGEQSVLVNGYAAFDGMTILSGTNIKTGKNSGATINLRQIGSVELCSETSAKLVFTADQVDLQLLSGKAKMITLKNINGVMTGLDGKVFKTDSTLETSIIGDCETTVVEVPSPVSGGSTGLFGMGMWGTAAAFGGIVGGSALVWFTAENGDVDRTVSGVQP